MTDADIAFMRANAEDYVRRQEMYKRELEKIA
jgi:hypothetical protein